MIRLWILAWLALLTGGAQAQDGGPLTGTLKTVAARGTILIGVRDGVVPFAFRNGAGEPVGFSVDLCRRIAGDVADLLNSTLLEPDAPAWQRGVRIAYVTITAEARLPSLVSGAIDLECGSTTANAERAKTVAFSPVFFLAGTKLLAPLAGSKGRTVTSYHDLAGGRVGVSAGTTNATVLQTLGRSVAPPIEIVQLPSLDAAYTRLASGELDAMASDDILLSGLSASHPDGRRFAVVGDFLSFEPYAVAFRRDDPMFADLVATSFRTMAADGALATRYRRWFTDKLPSGQTLAIPMSLQLSEIYRALGQPD